MVCEARYLLVRMHRTDSGRSVCNHFPVVQAYFNVQPIYPPPVCVSDCLTTTLERVKSLRGLTKLASLMELYCGNNDITAPSEVCTLWWPSSTPQGLGVYLESTRGLLFLDWTPPQGGCYY